MITLREFTSCMKPETKIFVDDRSKVGGAVESTTGSVWLELTMTGRDFNVDHITPHESFVVVTVSPIEGGKHDDRRTA